MTEPKPLYSVIVPAYQAADSLGLCLDALNAQTVARDLYEVIVVDDGSTDATGEIAQQAGARVITQRNAGPAAARNAGAARGAAIWCSLPMPTVPPCQTGSQLWRSRSPIDAWLALRAPILPVNARWSRASPSLSTRIGTIGWPASSPSTSSTRTAQRIAATFFSPTRVSTAPFPPPQSRIRNCRFGWLKRVIDWCSRPPRRSSTATIIL